GGSMVSTVTGSVCATRAGGCGCSVMGRSVAPGARSCRSGREPDAPQPTDGAHPLLGEQIGGPRGGGVLLLGQREDPVGGGEDVVDPLTGTVEGEAAQFVSHLDQPAGVDAEVGGVADAAVVQLQIGRAACRETDEESQGD